MTPSGKNVSLLFTYSDGSANTTLNLLKSNKSEVALNHTFVQPGSYIVTCYKLDEGENKSDSAIVQVCKYSSFLFLSLS